jgi:prepilin-type processing-associated H-X9-DG protein
MDAGSGLVSGAQGFDAWSIACRVRRIGTEVHPANLAASQDLYAPYHEREPYIGVEVTRDAAYGTDPRQRLDVFRAAGHGGGRPVVVFVHGGGFVAGDKHRPGSPYHDNVGLWAARQGMVGVTITHRLAPDFGWPAGTEDVAQALGWVRDNVTGHGGDPGQIHLMGNSSGAVHAALYLTRPEFHPPQGARIAGLVLLSGAYDLPTFDHARLRPYFGDDPARYAELSPLPGLLETDVPVLYTLSEFDPPAAHRQALDLVHAHLERHARRPHIAFLDGHNHFTTTAHLNTPDDTLGRHILRHIRRARPPSNE